MKKHTLKYTIRVNKKFKDIEIFIRDYPACGCAFICRCGENMPYFMPEKLNFKNIEFEYTMYGGKFVKSIKKGIV